MKTQNVVLALMVLIASGCGSTLHLYSGRQRSNDELALIITTNCLVTRIGDLEVDPQAARTPNRIALLPGKYRLVVSSPLYTATMPRFVGGREYREYEPAEQLFYAELDVDLAEAIEYELYCPPPIGAGVGDGLVAWDIELLNAKSKEVVLKQMLSTGEIRFDFPPQ